MTREGFRADLNGLRGISVALVFAFHLQIKGAGGGFLGVDVFFVISGYLMTQIMCIGLADARFSYWRFVAARAARIWPALAAMVVLLFVFGAWLLPPFDLQILAEQARAALLFSSNHHFLDRSGYITHAGDTHWLLHTWSLSVEWQFYLLYPLLLMALAKIGARRQVVMAVLAALMVLSFAVQMLQLRTHADASFFLLPGRCWELLAGGLVFLWLRDAPMAPLRWRSLAGYAGLLMVLGAALALAFMRRGAVGAGPWLLLPVAGVMLILWARDANNLVLRNPALQRLGLWSYSVYLWHWPIIVGLRMTEYPLDHPQLTTLATVGGSLVMGWLSYTCIERPGSVLRTAASAWRIAQKPALFMLLAGAVVAVAFSTEGFAFRERGAPGFYRGYTASVTALYFPDDCSNYKKPAAELKTCTVRKGNAARILVIGDSHAEYLYAWFVKHSAGSVDFFTEAECPPVPRFERTQTGYACKDYAAIAWGKALSNDYDTVIVSARWATVGLAGAPYCHQPEGKACVAPASVEAKQALVLAELKTALAATLATGKTVLMLDGAPESRFRVPERVAREQFWYGQPRLSVPVASLVAQTQWIEPVFNEFRGLPGFHRVSLRDRLCDTSTCRVYDTTLQRPIFLDESHIDPVWIAQQTDLFTHLLRRQ
ncbi:MAG: acyltransferase [Cytophagales bacterium]|nr:acyltransferase [Rhizobacter sp.]